MRVLSLDTTRQTQSTCVFHVTQDSEVTVMTTSWVFIIAMRWSVHFVRVYAHTSYEQACLASVQQGIGFLL